MMVVLPHSNALGASFHQSFYLHGHAEPFLPLAYTFLVALCIHLIEVSFPQFSSLLATILCPFDGQF
jgi:hypothetical protein